MVYDNYGSPDILELREIEKPNPKDDEVLIRVHAASVNALWGGSPYWVLESIGLLLLTGLSFALFGFALERILNPRIQTK